MNERNTGRANYKSGNRRPRRRVNRRDPVKTRVIAMCAAGIAALAVILVCVFLLATAYDIETVACEGNTKISSEALAQTSGIQTGGNIFLTSLSDKKKHIEELDYIESCEITRELPHTIKITVVERHPSAYFNLTGGLAVTDMDGGVLEVLNSADADEIIKTKITEEPEPSGTPMPEEDEDENDSDEPDPDSTADGTIWGYDDDGDPIYRVNGGHYEFDEDGNRFFVDDTPEESSEPSAEPKETEPKDGELQRTQGGAVIYSAPVVYGVELKKYDVGKRIESSDNEKLESVLGALKALDAAGLLDRTTKFDAENVNDVKFTVEDRLEVWFGTFDEFEYKAKFTATVINNNLSPYERAIVDFRDSKLYVRSANYRTPIVIEAEATPDPDADKEDDESDTKKSTKNKTDEDGDSDSAANPKSTKSPKATATPRPKSKSNVDDSSSDEDEVSSDSDRADTSSEDDDPDADLIE